MNLLKDIEIIGTYVASISLSAGSVLFFWHLCFPKYELIFDIGQYYVVWAFFVNLAMLIILISAIAVYKQRRPKLLKVIGQILFNIPVAILYFIILIALL
ncbi:hypothetical protein Q2T40_14225 [Winogradskyella maritima]|uniref:Uncharacterized protein n=1 Tax=Winogradskyella maritima TaxID=1517766 RepID=A0ABV8AGH9_9FLAO|nr:hypothetical protein [Winogradskyella maritima]